MTVALFALFGAGIASFLAPCVLPLVPVWLGVVAGSNRQGAVAATLTFVGGFALVFALLGVAAGAIGGVLTGRPVVIVGGSLLVLFGLSLLVPGRGPLAREFRPMHRFQQGAPFVIGVSFGAAWTPCVGPLLGTALGAAAADGRPLRSGLLLVAYSAGLGLPFVVASLGLTGVDRVMTWVQRRSHRIEVFAGLTLVLLGVLVVSNTYERLTGSISRVLPFVKGN